MALLDEYKPLYPEIWEETGLDELRFINALETRGIIDHAMWSFLLETVAERRLIGPPEEEVKLTFKQKYGVLLWERISDFFALMFSDVWKFFPEVLGKALWGWIKQIKDDLATSLSWLSDFFKMGLVERPGDPPFLIEVSQAYNKKPSIMGFLWIMLYRLGYTIGFAVSVIGIVSKDAVRKLNEDYSPMLPDISALVTYYYKTPADREIVYEKAAQQGFDKREVEIYIRSMEALFSVDDLKNMRLRDIIDDKTLLDQLRRSGWTDEAVEKLKQIFYLVPGPSDQIRFAVREAFDEDYIKRFDTLKDFPEGFAEQAQKVGINRYWAEKFWIAHWELPPLAAAYEMLHRDVITKDELAELFKGADVMPWWRDKLEAISYNPLTRVDVRRMYKVGTLDREGVHRAYLDVGYNEKNAALMTDFTIKWVSDDERDLSKADILGAYQRRLFSKSAATKALTDMGYDKSEAALLMSRIDYELAKKKKTSVLKNLEKGYKKGIYDSSKVQGRMQELNMSGAEITELINLWDAETKDDTASLSKSDLDGLFKKRVIDEAIYRAEMAKLKYIERDIEWMVKLNKG